MLLAYFPKSPVNFVPLFLEIGRDPWGVDRGVSADGGARGQKGSIWGVLGYAGVAR